MDSLPTGSKRWAVLMKIGKNLFGKHHLKAFKLKLVGVNDKLIGLDHKSNNEEGNSKEGAHKYKSGDTGNKTRDNYKGLKCLYTNIHTTGNKQVSAITETWWNGIHDWNSQLEGYKLFKRNRPNKRG